MIVHYDGTFAGLLTVFELCTKCALSPTDIRRPPYPAAGLFDQIEEIPTDARAAAGLRDRINHRLSPRTMDTVRLAFLSEHPGVDMMIWRYLAFGWKTGHSLDTCIAHPDVHAVHCWAARTVREGHRLKGLARFRETTDGTLYAPIYADANVLPLLAPHFSRRLDRPWVLHDVRRSLGAIGEGGCFLLGILTAPEDVTWSADELSYQELWRTFHHNIAIPGRISRRRQRQFMPIKYWEYLVEMRQAV